jgi:hypothetical protein
MGHKRPEPAENIGCRGVHVEQSANGEKWNTRFRHPSHEERDVSGHEEHTGSATTITEKHKDTLRDLGVRCG